jgi:class 3 adenylate cyclase/tetratricopeptide (TPR) repeat protein
MEASSEKIAAAIAALEAQRGALGDSIIDTALAPLRRELAALEARERHQPQQLKQVSVLFVDVVGSTAIGQQLDPEEIHSVMDGALERFTAIVQQHHGRVLQYTGDGMLAAFGSEESSEDDVESAVRAGLSIIENAHHLAPAVRERHGVPDFNVRAGVHTGTVLLGAGVDAEGSIRGATVNVAARMEQSAPPGKLRISHDSFRHVRGQFDVTEQAPISVKGIDQPLRSYLVERAKPRAFRVTSRGIDGVPTLMVGRQAELYALCAAFDSIVSERRARSVTVVAEAGMGKSRLLAEFQQIASQQSCWMLPARAHPRSGLHAYGLLRDMLARQLQIGEADPAELARDKLVKGLAAQFAEEGEAPIHLIGHLIGLDFSASEHVRELLGDEQQFRLRAFDAAALCLRRLADARPVVVVLDDLHWADTGTLDFVRHLRSSNHDSSLLMLMLTRPSFLEQRPGWSDGEERHARIDLEPLDKTHSHELVDQLLNRLPEVPAALRALLTGGAEGNPFYMEELVKMLIDDGVIAIEAAGWRVLPEKLLIARVPPTLTGVLQARLDALPTRERRALQQAAVVGHVFWERALAAIDATALQVMPSLLRKRLIVPHDTPTTDDTCEYAFQHNLLHQVTYDGLLKDPKRAAHAAVGAFWSARAEVARSQDVTPAACRALAEAQHHRCKSDAQGYVAWFEGQFSNYLNAYAARALRPLAEELIDICAKEFGAEHPQSAKALTNLARVSLMLGDVERAEPLLHSAITAQEKSLPADHTDLALTLAVLGGCCEGRGDMIAAEPLYKRALEIRQRVFGPHHALTLNALDNLAKVTLELGRLDDAESLSRQVLLAREGLFGPDHPNTAFALTALGEVLTKRGLFSDAEPLIRRALTIQKMSLPPDHPETGLSMWHLSEVLRGQSRLDEAEALARKTLELWEASFGPQHEWTAWGLISLAECRLAQGASTEAAAFADRAVQVVQRVYGNEHSVLGSTLNLQGCALMAAGQYRAAESALARSLEIQLRRNPGVSDATQATRAMLDLAREKLRQA